MLRLSVDAGVWYILRTGFAGYAACCVTRDQTCQSNC